MLIKLCDPQYVKPTDKCSNHAARFFGKAELPIVLVNGEMKMNGRLSADALAQVVNQLAKQG